jgi:heme/copper-type cytochrome/quinol oxidase subunit 3
MKDLLTRQTKISKTSMKNYLFASLFAFALACNAYAVTDNNQNGRPGNPGHVYNVPDTGSTAALLALSVIVMAIGAMRLLKV